MKPVHPRITNFYEPIGIDRDPVFAWEYQGGEGAVQSAYRLVINRSGGQYLYDSGKVLSAQQNNITAAIPGWQSHTRYAWRVCAWDQSDRPGWSDFNPFVTGILPENLRQPAWISSGTAADKPYYAARRFHLTVRPEKAYLSICGLGQFVATLNGRRVGRHELDPGWTDYHKRTLYVTFDVSPYLVAGENTLIVEVANGWYIGDTADGRHFYTKAINYEPFGKALPLWLRMTVDGAEPFCLDSDDQFITWSSQTTLANVYGSEDIDRAERIGPDLRLAEEAGITRPARLLTEDEQPAGILTAQSHPPVGIKNTYAGILAGQPAPGILVYDLGQNMAGLIEISVRGRKGQRVVVRMAETMNPDGSGTIRLIVPTWSAWTLAGGPQPEVFRHQFSYAAGRWVQAEGVTTEPEDPELPQLLAVRGHFITTAARDVGHFTCSDQMYNQINNLVLKAVESNLNHVHSDCPTVEKLGWLEESQQMAPSIMFSKDVDALWSKIATDACDSQYGPDESDVDVGKFPHAYGPGLVTSVAPRYAKFNRDWGHGSYWDIVPWGSFIIMGPWQQYRFYGNRQILADIYPAAVRYLDWLEQKYRDYPRIYGKTGSARFLCHGLGDWGIGDASNKSRENTETAFFYQDLVLMASIAELLGKPEDAIRYRVQAQAVCDNYNAHLLVEDPESGDWCYRSYDVPDRLVIRQVNQAIPLSFGMVTPDKKDSVIRSFIHVAETGVLNSGEIGLRFLFNTLHRLGRQDIINKMILQEEHPSYARFVRRGETTLPEYWADRGRSRNHDMMGQIVEWFYSGLLGLSSEDGFSTFQVAPVLPQTLDWVEGQYHAITGLIRVRFEQTDLLHQLTVEIPDNTRARLVLPRQTAAGYDRVLCNGIPQADPNHPLEVGGGYYVISGCWSQDR
ncbi:MAG: family 78 glycoside hydrolase catalytic domain [Bacillota bacterium]|nr:family 78 glycoside hydrolase catalytic domain [Bacillota bacterium]